MIARAHGDHIHSSRPDGGYDRCHGRPGCHPQLVGLDVLDDDTRMREEAMRRLAVGLNMPVELCSFFTADREPPSWIEEKVQEIADDLTRKFGLDQYGLHLSFETKALPLRAEEH